MRSSQVFFDRDMSWHMLIAGRMEEQEQDWSCHSLTHTHKQRSGKVREKCIPEID